MCGIIGYTGSENVQDVVLDALELLEYRGYDSAGMAVKDELTGETKVYKCAGRVKDLRELCKKENFSSKCGIGHTRWATHGGVTDVNAHPHRQGQVTLVHNGIVENYRDLMIQYEFAEILKSETDTEIISNLISFYYEKLEDIEKAFFATINAVIVIVSFERISSLFTSISRISEISSI